MTQLAGPRSFSMHAEQLADLYRGSLHLISSLTQGWAVGLIFEEGATLQACEDADRLEDQGMPILWLDEEQLHQLATGRSVELLFPDNHRYLIHVSDVEQLTDLLGNEE